MAKAKREVKENLKLVDVVIEVLDARIPVSSRNPDINEIIGAKPKMLVLNKSDLADPDLTGAWVHRFEREGTPATGLDLLSGKGLRSVPVAVRKLAAPRIAALVAVGRQPRAARCMVLGIPNVGKSYLINRLVDRRATKTGYKPGVTRGQQWIRMAGNLELLDTPGILWPKFADPEAAFRLAITGAIKEEIFPVYAVARRLAEWLVQNKPEALSRRYGIKDLPADIDVLLETIGRQRGFIVSGGVVDLEKSAHNVLKEFREGKFGRITLERPEDF